MVYTHVEQDARGMIRPLDRLNAPTDSTGIGQGECSLACLSSSYRRDGQTGIVPKLVSVRDRDFRFWPKAELA